MTNGMNVANALLETQASAAADDPAASCGVSRFFTAITGGAVIAELSL